MGGMDVDIRPLDAAGVATAVEWARLEGWNPGLEDAAAFHAADPGGYLGLYVDGELAATISAVRHGEDFAFVGFYICRPELRGKGLGLKLWNAALAGVEGRTVGLDGVVDQQHNYAKSGFVLAHRNIRYGGKPALAESGGKGLKPLVPADAARLTHFEKRHRLFPAPRPAFLSAWLAMPNARALQLIENDEPAGCGVIRRCHAGHKIGPLFAPSGEAARSLLAGLIEGCEGDEVFLDVPETNPAAVALARDLGLAPVFETARMYKGVTPDLDLSKVFGITTFELG